MSKNLDGLSIREFARREGVSETLARQRIKKGYLPTLANGRVSEEMLGTAWRRGTAPGAKPVVRRREDESPEQAAARIVFREGRIFDTEDDARLHKESFLALLRELEYAKEVGAVVEIAESIRQFSAELSTLRTKLLAIPNKVAPRIALLSSQKEVRALVEREIREALAELKADDPEQNSAAVAARARARKADRR